MTCPAIKFDDPPADHDVAKIELSLDQAAYADSLFQTFVDEIDIWARRALAANGFGDHV